MKRVLRIPRIFRALLPAAILLAACDTDSGRSIVDPEPSPTPPGAPQIFVQPVSGQGQEGEVGSRLAGALVVRVHNEAQKPVAGAQIVWTAENGQVSAASTLTDSAGLASVQWVLGRQAGPQTVRASLGEREPVTFGATARPGRAVTVAVEPSPIVLTRGGKARARVVARDAFGNVATGRPVAVRVVDQAVAGVSTEQPEGGPEAAFLNVNAGAPGTTVVTAEVEGATGNAVVMVTDNASTPVVTVGGGNGQTGTVGETASQPLVVRVVLADGTPVSGRIVHFVVTSGGGRVDPPSPATDANGNASTRFTLGPNAGTQTVVATVEGLPPITFTVVAQPGPVTRLSVTPASLSLAKGGSAQLSVSGTDGSGNAVIGRPISFTSSDPAVATVSATGAVTGVNAGSATVAVRVDGASVNVPVTVTSTAAGPVASVVVGPSPLAIRVGASAQLSVVAKDAAGNLLAGRPVTFTTSNPAVASVSASGVVTGIAAGSATVTATVDGVSAPVAVGVTAEPAAVSGIVITPSPLTLRVGLSAPLTVVAKDAAGNLLGGRAVTFTASNPAVASVSASGVVTAHAVGSAAITATVEGVSATIVVTVTATAPAAVASVTISPSPLALKVGVSAQLAVVARDAAGNPLVGRAVTFASSNTAVVSVSASGVVTAHAPGTATVTATVEGVTATLTVSVTADPVPVVSVAILPSPITLRVGASVPLTVTARDAAGNLLAGRAVVYTSSNPAVASVSASGVVTGIAAGSVTITATVEGVKATVSVTVTADPVPVASITINPSPLTLKVGLGALLNVTLRDAAGNLLTGRVVTFATSNPAVATVSPTGLVLGLVPGTATVTATADGVRATVNVTVTL